jgi:hypothetical protein
MNRRGKTPAKNDRRRREGVGKTERSRKQSRLAPKNWILERRKVV